MVLDASVFSDASKTILVVENDELSRKSIALHLAKEGYQVVTTNRGREGLALAEKVNPDLLLLDVMLPDVNGFDVCRRLRERGNTLPVILVTDKTDDTDLIVGLEIGADDCVAKPLNTRALIARVRSRLRRQASPLVRCPRCYRFDDVKIVFASQRVTRGDNAVELSPREFDILQLLIRYRGQVVSRNTLLAAVWGYNYPPTTRTVDNHIVKLRRKLEEDPSHPEHILSIYGEGYKFVARARPSARPLVSTKR